MREDLDLQHTIRPGLDILANEIVIALKKRTRFPHNPQVYEPGLVRTDPTVSLLHYVLGKVEHTHAALGRYTFASQESFTDTGGIAAIIMRTPPVSPIRRMPSGMGDRLTGFYLGWIREVCHEGTDSDTFGETVTSDVDALLGILERINLGKYVAESKYVANPEGFARTGGERAGILELIVKKDREAQVYDLARRLAEHYELESGPVIEVFQWMVDATIDVEVAYVRMRLGLRD